MNVLTHSIFLSAVLLSTAAAANTYNFSYNDGSTDVTGVLKGIEINPGVVTVTQVDELTVNGISSIPGQALFILDSWSHNTDPIVSFNGTIMDIWTYPSNTTTTPFFSAVNGTTFAVQLFYGYGPIYATNPPIPNATLGTQYGLPVATWIPSGWSLTDVTAVPVPSSIWLFGTSLLGLLGLKRRNN